MTRTMKLSAVAAALAIGGGLAFSGQAMADQVKGDYRGHQGDSFDTSAGNGGGGRFTFDRDALTNSGTEFQGTLVANGGPTGLDGEDDLFYAFCLEPDEQLKDPDHFDVVALKEAPVDGVVGAMGARAKDLRLLFGHQYADFSQSITNQKAIALQIAVWEIANENTGTYNVESGSISFNNQAAAKSTAQGWLKQINDGHWTTEAQGLVGLASTSGASHQDFVAQVVPIPAAAWLFGSALVGTAALGRRRGKDKAKAKAAA